MVMRNQISNSFSHGFLCERVRFLKTNVRCFSIFITGKNDFFARFKSNIPTNDFRRSYEHTCDTEEEIEGLSLFVYNSKA